MSKIALITGATSGIGRATAVLFAQHGINLILCGRREERLKSLQTELEKQVKVTTLNFDVRSLEEVNRAFASLPEEFKSISILINNAGNAHGLDPIQQGDVADWDAMIDINVKGLLYVSRAVTPGMVSRGSGQIVNIGSIAGKEVYPNGNVYCASKHAVDALTQGMRMDLFKHGIRVAGVHPGLVETEFSVVRFKGDEEKAKTVYQGITPLYAEDIADTIYYIVSRPAHVNVADVVIFPSAQAAATLVDRKI